MARWLESLAEYDLKVQHRPGKKHTNADALSRLPGQLWMLMSAVQHLYQTATGYHAWQNLRFVSCKTLMKI